MGHILFLLTIIMKPPPETLQGNSNLSNAILSVAIPSFLLKITREFVSRANPLKKTKDAATATAAAAANSSNAIQSINRMRALVLLPRSLMAAGIVLGQNVNLRRKSASRLLSRQSFQEDRTT